MIKAKITKNIIRKTQNSFGLSLTQIIVGIIAVLLGITEYMLLKDVLSTNLLMTIIFITLTVLILFGCVNIQGLNLFAYLGKMLKGPDVRYYEAKGVFTNELSEKKEK